MARSAPAARRLSPKSHHTEAFLSDNCRFIFHIDFPIFSVHIIRFLAFCFISTLVGVGTGAGAGPQSQIECVTAQKRVSQFVIALILWFPAHLFALWRDKIS